MRQKKIPKCFLRFSYYSPNTQHIKSWSLLNQVRVLLSSDTEFSMRLTSCLIEIKNDINIVKKSL